MTYAVTTRPIAPADGSEPSDTLQNPTLGPLYWRRHASQTKIRPGGSARWPLSDRPDFAVTSTMLLPTMASRGIDDALSISEQIEL